MSYVINGRDDAIGRPCYWRRIHQLESIESRTKTTLLTLGTLQADLDSHPATEILPFLYLGNGRDARDAATLQRLNVRRVLNVTSDLPGFCGSAPAIVHKQLPAADSGHQNLRQYFDDAFRFIGQSTSPTPNGILIRFISAIISFSVINSNPRRDGLIRWNLYCVAM